MEMESTSNNWNLNWNSYLHSAITLVRKDRELKKLSPTKVKIKLHEWENRAYNFIH